MKLSSFFGMRELQTTKLGCSNETQMLGMRSLTQVLQTPIASLREGSDGIFPCACDRRAESLVQSFVYLIYYSTQVENERTVRY